MDEAEQIAAKLTKASRRAIVRISHVGYTEEGYPGPKREDAYSLWWGRDGKHRLVHQPEPFAISTCGCRWKWKLTPLGLAVRQAVHKEQSNVE
jgi:hypothetical protein